MQQCCLTPLRYNTRNIQRKHTKRKFTVYISNYFSTVFPERILTFNLRLPSSKEQLLSTMRGVEKSALKGDLSQPREWREVGEVQQLYLYPVKSLSCVPVNSFTTGPWAAESGEMVDRQLIVLDRKGKPAQAEQWPHMTLIMPRLENGWLTLTYPGMEDITVQLPDTLTMKAWGGRAVKVGGDPCRGLDLG